MEVVWITNNKINSNSNRLWESLDWILQWGGIHQASWDGNNRAMETVMVDNSNNRWWLVEVVVILIHIQGQLNMYHLLINNEKTNY